MKFSTDKSCPVVTLFDHAGGQLSRVQSFDTETGLAVVKVGNYGFYYAKGDEQARQRLLAELPPELHCRIKEL